jgi:type III pantothenate kinase
MSAAAMDLGIDIGNTETTVGLFDGPVLCTRWRLSSSRRRTPDEVGVLLRQLLRDIGVEPADIGRVTYATVMPAAALVMAAACRSALRVEAVGIDANTPLPIRLDVDEPLGVGPDRIVNAAAAHLFHGGNTIVVDLGTATTYDCVTGDGVFIGGAIAPGVRTGADHLFERTARLPRVAVTRPDRVIGRRTEACLRSGIFYGAVDAIDGMIRRIREEWGRGDAGVIATGGLATLVAPACRTVRAIEPNLTLHGIRAVRDHIDGRPPEPPAEDLPTAAPR